MLLLNWNSRCSGLSESRAKTVIDVVSYSTAKDDNVEKHLHYAFIKNNQMSECWSRTYHDIASGSLR